MDDLDSLLADLQSAVPQRNSNSFQQDNSNGVYQQGDSHVQQTNGYQQQPHNGRVISNGFSQPHSPQNNQHTYVQESREEVRTETRSSGPTPQVKNDELDSLLSELNQTKYSNAMLLDRASTNTNGSIGRPPVESYINELNSVNSTSNRQQKYVSDVGHSTATRDLDDLMNDLSDFKINSSESRNVGPTHATQDDLDSLLGELNQRKYTTVDGRVGSGGYTSRDHRQVTSSNHVTNMEPRKDYTVTKTEQVYAKPEKPRSPSPDLPPPPVKEPTPVADELDCMLGSLKNHMTEQGVTTTQKGCCCACDKPIVGQVITALGKTWHPEHFTCTHCSSELGSKNFFERDGKPYCESCYHELFSPKCAYCDKSILDKCVTALDKTWHPEHFFCAQCGNTFGEGGFHEKDGKAYCRDDYYNMFAPKCGGCNAPIMENYISALNAQWHPECFVCRDCRQPFSGGSFFDHEGMPYCETHYHSKRGSLCAGCHKPITGRCITAMFRKYHPEHFTCSYCMRQLNKGTFKEQNDKPYCHSCFEKLYG